MQRVSIIFYRFKKKEARIMDNPFQLRQPRRMTVKNPINMSTYLPVRGDLLLPTSVIRTFHPGIRQGEKLWHMPRKTFGNSMQPKEGHPKRFTW